MAKEIEILDFDGKNLILSDDGETEVNSLEIEENRRIRWSIGKDCLKVKSFKIEGKEKYEPFQNNIPRNFRTTLPLIVKKNHTFFDWKYNIYWTDEKDCIHLYDPLIAIKPRSFKSFHGHLTEKHSSKKWFVIGLGLIGVAWWLSQGKKKSE
jgi:hypothetical protein